MTVRYDGMKATYCVGYCAVDRVSDRENFTPSKLKIMFALTNSHEVNANYNDIRAPLKFYNFLIS